MPATVKTQKTQQAFTRRDIFAKLASTGAVIATAGTFPGSALAAPEPAKKDSLSRRGGSKGIADTHNGTELNGKEADVSTSLMAKMGYTEPDPKQGRVDPKRTVTTSNGAAPRY
eukprot:CAMPEP_0198253326 /NCGR_PEP_ID=MMETSP1447-20131203/3778_1 /TAXON_ID=420782 /ORGANISM="Chaetoceros dichaeta, Strain CCMP1751" /LENGTH=113 /DNA_ID=CAMNT_0043938963 /DNA_START=148 /DNA_END=489 /DNA_ORIENTATION=-